MSTLKSAALSIEPQDLFTSSATQGTDLGAFASTGDGRYFRYVSVGATTLVPGTLQQASAQDTTNQNPSGGLAVAAAAAGTNQVTITSSITLAAGLLAGGFLSVNVAPGQGYTYKISNNSAVASATGCVITLEDNLIVALTTSSKVVVSPSPYTNVIQCPATTPTGVAVGVPVFAIVNGQYGWIQTRGIVSLLGTAGTAVGSALSPSSGTAGGVITAAAGKQIVAVAQGTFVTTEYDLAVLLLD
jgi:hypothetical protein